MYLWIAAVAALAGADTETDANYYWRTGQQDKAIELIAEAYERQPDNLTNQRLYLATRIHNGDGGALELQHRAAFNDDNNDLVGRLTLANVLAYRHPKKGSWCKDAEALLKPIGDQDAALHREVVQARVITHTRCEESTDVDQAAWVKIIKSGDLGSAEKTAYAAGGGYAGEDLADAIKLALAKSPRHVEYMVPLWDEDTGGPGLAFAQKAALKGAKNAMAGDDPQAAAAAYWFYKGIDNEKGTVKALAAWKALDPGANSEYNGALTDIHDPKVYRRLNKANGDLAKLDEAAEKIPESGYLTGYYEFLRYKALNDTDDKEAAYEAAKTAYENGPDIVAFAEKFAQATASTQKSRDKAALELGVTAITAAMANPESKRQTVRVFIRSQLYIALERYEEAEGDLLSLFEKKPTSRLYHRSLGNLYKTMEETESAIVHYTAAMQDPDADAPAEKSEKRRDNLMASDSDWVAGPKRLKGRAFPIEIEGSRAKVTAVVVGASWSAPTEASLADLADLVDSHGMKGFKGVAVLVDRNEPDMKALIAANEKITLVYGGPEAARKGRIMSVPMLYVLDDKHRVLGAFRADGWSKATELILARAK